MHAVFSVKATCPPMKSTWPGASLSSLCHQYHLGNDLFRPVAVATVICMEMTLVLVEYEEAADAMGE